MRVSEACTVEHEVNKETMEQRTGDAVRSPEFLKDSPGGNAKLSKTVGDLERSITVI